MNTTRGPDGHALTFRVANPSDIEVLWTLRTQAARVQCAGYYPPLELDAWLSCPPSEAFHHHLARGHAIVGEVGSNPIGYTVIDAREHELEALFVAPEHFRRGFGHQLLHRAEQLATALGIKTLTLSAALNAIDFYLAHGYELLKINELAHRSGVNLERGIMRKTLSLGEEKR